MISVVRMASANKTAVKQLLGRYQMQLVMTDANDIPGSFWGDEEAGLLGNQVVVRTDTPIHSLFHEACHFICMDDQRRQNLHTNAGGDYAEEDAVCFLQIVLADYLTGYSQQQMMSDMDAWGYSFRLGSTARWFYEDAQDAKSWLCTHDIITSDMDPTFKLRH